MKVLLLIATIVGALAVSTASASSVQNDLLYPQFNLVHRDELVPQGETRDLLEHALKLINMIVDQAVKAIDKVQQEIERLLDDLLLQGEELLEFAKAEINRIIQKALEDLNLENLGLQECAEIVPQRVEEITKTAFDNLKKCFDDFAERVEISRENIKEHIAFLTGKVQQIQEVGQSCVDGNGNLIDQVKCLFDHVPETNAIVVEILSDVGQLLAETVKEAVSLLNDTRGCLLDVVKQAENEVQKLVQEVLECVQQQG
ncbi:uncharacterized protein LOC6038886 [Culex quinquefasciatus]|uniref:uncharacterized protein LOC6038886 n=1 Tax=Culex quinquefasciatus TaxID=7176 RepID=UPI0018E3565E|nr:uncharacterized protein LOC6038886 [Culex quinquefasciatus]